MDEISPRGKAPRLLGSTRRGSSDEIDLPDLFAAARRQAPLVALFAAIGGGAALLYILAAAPLFSARETVLLDQVRAAFLDQVSSLPSAILGDSAVDSEVQIIRSQAIALKVVDNLRLAEDPEFMNPARQPAGQLVDGIKGMVRGVSRLVVPAEEVQGGRPADPRFAAAARLRRGLDVTRVGRSYVIEIGYESSDPDRAAAIANAYGEAYQTFQLESNLETTGSTSAWLRARVETLRERSLEAKQAAQSFRRENRLLLVSGEPIAGQELLELTRQLAAAQSETAQARSRWEEYSRLLEQGPDGAISASAVTTGPLSDEALARLRELYLDAERRDRVPWSGVADGRWPRCPAGPV